MTARLRTLAMAVGFVIGSGIVGAGLGLLAGHILDAMGVRL